MNLKRAPIFILLCALLFPACANFSQDMYRGLTVSQVSWEEAMNALDIAERQGLVTRRVAEVALTYEEKHRLTHNMIEELTEQWVNLGLIKANEDQRHALRWKIISYQTTLTETVAEFVTFLRRMGIINENPFRPTATD